MTEQELVEVVDERGDPIALVPRAVMRAENLRHRSVGIVVRSPGGESVLAHQRAPWKDVWPSRWDLAFGGVCAPGEDWLAAAVREVAEEAGVEVDPEALTFVVQTAFENDAVRVVGRIYELCHAGPFSHPDGEVVATEWVRLDTLASWVAEHQLCDDTAAIVLPQLL